MPTFRTRPRLLLIALLALVALSVPVRSARAAEVEAQLESRDVYAGIPFEFTLAVTNASSFVAPALPAIDGIVVLGPPSQSRSSVTNIVNGRATRRDSVSLNYSLIATRLGRITIPRISIDADGQTLTTNPITITVTEPDAGDLLFARIVAEDDTIFQGESVALTLRIWIKPYDDSVLAGPLNSETMWSLIDLNRSAWGDFLEPIREQVGQLGGRRRLSGRPVQMEDADGVPTTYYLYELSVKTWPQKSGAIDVKPVALMMNYPVRLQRSRSVFSRGDLEIAESTTLVAKADPPAVRVEAPPAAGRPDSYRDAVGRFDFEVSARPTEVAVGDPITLTMRITDRTPGGSRLGLLQPPPLDQLPELANGFKVPSDPLAGVVDKNTKVFTQTIRAKNDMVSEIPPIPFAAFDPDQERYVVAMSKAIPLVVTAASTMALTDVVGANGSIGAAATELTTVEGGLLANATGPDALLANHAFSPNWRHGAAVLAPPLLFLLTLVGRRRVRRLRHDDGYARRRNARRNALRRIADAGRGGGNHAAAAVALAVSDYVADRTGAPPGALTRFEAIDALHRNEVNAELVADVARLLEECDQARYAGGGQNGEVDRGTDAVADRARQCVDRLEREKIR